MLRFYCRFTFLFAISLVVSGCQKNTEQQKPFDNAAAKKRWNNKQHQWDLVSLKILENGRLLYIKNCGGCHGSSGSGDNLIGAPALKSNSFVTGKAAGYIKLVLEGKPKRAMPAFKKLDNQTLAAILSYERNAWGNNSYSLITPEQIEKYRTKVTDYDK